MRQERHAMSTSEINLLITIEPGTDRNWAHVRCSICGRGPEIEALDAPEEARAHVRSHTIPTARVFGAIDPDNDGGDLRGLIAKPAPPEVSR